MQGKMKILFLFFFKCAEIFDPAGLISQMAPAKC